MKILNAGGKPFKLGYDATIDKSRRQPATSTTKQEDLILKASDRKKLISQSRDIHRNFSIAGWMIRKHLDYVSTFNFQSRSGDKALDKDVEDLIKWWSRPKNFDVTGRHSLTRMIRLLEGRRTVDGDVFVVKLRDGRVQGVEGDRVKTPDKGLPDGVEKKSMTQGVLLAKSGAPRAYAVCKREKNGRLIFERLLRAMFVEAHGFYDRIDQVRGISPIAAAMNTLRDTYEAFDYALAKAKVSQLFALAFYRNDYNGEGEIVTRETAIESDESGDGDLEAKEQQKYEVDFGRGPIKLELKGDDRAEFLESKNPSGEFQNFTSTMIGAAIKSLDIPYSFYDESFTNYSGSRQALLQYEQSAKVKRADVRQLLNNLTAWRLSLFIQDGDLTLPAGMTISGMGWEWVAAGLPWIDPLKETKADIEAVAAGMASTLEVVKRRGRDAYEIADEEAAYRAYRVGLNLPVDAKLSDIQVIEVNNG